MSTDETILWEESFLMTKEDYIDYSQEKSRMMTPKINMILLRIFGILAVCGGVIAMIYGSSEFWIKASFILLILIGFYLLSYYEVIVPVMVRNRAVRIYEFYQRSMVSQTIRLYADRIEVMSEDRKLRLMKKKIYGIREGKNSWILFYDRENFCYVPKRILDESRFSYFEELADEKKQNDFNKISERGAE